MISLMYLPMPPTSNSMYYSTIVHGKIRHFASKELNHFRKECEIYAATNAKKLKEYREFLEYWLKLEYHIRLGRHFFLPYSRIYRKDGKPKKLDVTNRIKAIDDSVTQMLGFDDKHIFCGSESKYKSPNDTSFCHLHFSPMTL